LQSQLYEQSLANERRLREITLKLTGNTGEANEIARLKIELQELRNIVQKNYPVSGETRLTPDSVQREASSFPKTHDFRYVAFEEIFRGSSEWVTERLRKYAPYFVTAPEPILDIGCGRGEFLNMMKEIKKDAYGIEMNQYEVETLASKGFKVLAEPITAHLSKLEGDSVGSVFCAQGLEHLSPDAVYEMLSRLAVVMKSGACVLIETINPLSVFAYHHLYFKDPTHIFPVHPQTLSFFLRYAGFKNVEVHPITPVPEHEKLPPPDSADTIESQRYLNFVAQRLNDLLYSNLEYYAVGYKP